MADGKLSKKVQSEMRDKRFLMNLPSGIIVEIFSRLPAVTVMNCKIVCKKSRCLLSTPEFAKLHLSRSTLRLVSFRYDLRGRREFCRLFEFKDEIDHHDIYYILQSSNQIWVLSIARQVLGPPTLVGSVNGLVCFSNFGHVGTFFNGSLRWMIKDLEGSKLISCFHLEE